MAPMYSPPYYKIVSPYHSLGGRRACLRRCKHCLHSSFSSCCSILAVLLKVGGCSAGLFLVFIYIFSSSPSNGPTTHHSTLRPTTTAKHMSATGTMRKRIVHLDLKGAPPKPEYYKELFGLFQQLKLTGVLIEYEDMFPYSGRLASLSGPLAYEPITIQYINTLAAEHNLEVIPFIQTFGHMEFVLKQEGPFTDLREVPERADTICPSDHRSLKLIKEMLTQVIRLPYFL
uniref:Beta-N-acetylhexosaminidase n=1 Tax=Ditylenchus dipsaci TaxID=166011 RepID=A0A915DT68_9BILA